MTRRALALLLALVLLAWTPPASADEAHVEGRPEPRAAAPETGSFLAVVDRARSQRLVLVDVDGHAETLVQRRRRSTYAAVQLADWSPDGRTVLLDLGGAHRGTAVALDLLTRETRTVRLGEQVAEVALDPDGSGLLATAWSHGPERRTFRLLRIGWDGTTTRLGGTDGSLLAGPGHTLVTAGRLGRSLRVLSLDTGRQLSEVDLHAYCSTVRWYDATRLLLTCSNGLRLVDPATGQGSRLTATPVRTAASHTDARTLRGRTYVQVFRGCDTTTVDRLTRSGALHPVRTRGLSGNVDLVGATQRRLAVVARSGCEGGHSAPGLRLLDPRTGRSQPLLQLGRRESFAAVWQEGDARAVSY